MAKLQIQPEDWAELTKLLDSALDLPSEERARWLEALDSSHAPLKPHLQHLLSYSSLIETNDFLETLPELPLHTADLDPPAGAGIEAGKLIGPYRLLRELGSGGMSLVWLAERADGLINRPVALKFPRGLWIREGLRERMARERELLASLEHPGIARLYDAGLSEAGDPYLAIEYVEGRPLDAYCAERGLGASQRLRLFLQIVDAVAYAHSKLIIHRDLKPANILVTSDGQVRLLDFGIGKLLDEHQPHDTRVTELSARALTPDYASPEQISGEPLSIATDIYSLGVVLYELLTSRRPYRLKRDSRGALEDAILEADPQRPSEAATESALRRALKGDLDAITLRALQKAPARRYPSAHALADDVRRHLNGHAVLARADSAGYRLRKLLSRHKLATAAVVITTAGVLLGSGVAVWQARIAQREARRAESIAQFIASTFQGVDPNLLGSRRPLTALEILDQARRRVETELLNQPALKLQLQSVIARSYLGLFEPQRAHELLSAALGGASTAATSDPQLGRTLHLLMAQALLELTRLDEAESHIQLVLGAGPPDDEYVAAQVTQSAIEYARGRYAEAAAAAREALAVASRAPAMDTALLSEAHTSIAKSAGMLREEQVSLDHNEQAYSLAMRAFNDDSYHPKVLETEHNYAASLIDVGRIEDAIPHLQRSLSAAEKTYGRSSLIAGQYLVRLGLAHMERGELARAIELIEGGNRIESTFDVGPTPSVSGRLRTLARANIAARRMDAAAAHIDAALAVMRKLDAPFMMRVLEADEAFIRAANDGNIAAATTRLAQVIATQDQGESRYKTHLPDIYVGTLHLWNDDARAALPHLERGVELARVQTRKSDLGEALTQLAYARLETGDVAGAKPRLQEALETLRRTQVALTPAQAEALLGLARVELHDGRHAAALDLADDVSAFWNAFDPQNRGAGVAFYWLGRIHAARNEPREAQQAFDTAARTLAGSPLPAHRTLLRRIRSR